MWCVWLRKKEAVVSICVQSCPNTFGQWYSFGIFTQYATTMHLEWISYDVLKVSFNVRVWLKIMDEPCTNDSCLYSETPYFSGSKLFGQLATQLFNGHLCVIPIFVYLIVSKQMDVFLYRNSWLPELQELQNYINEALQWP